MNVLVIDVGGTHVKVLVTGESEPRKFASGPKLTARQMVAGVKKITADWNYDAVTIGFPGPVLRNRPVAEPRNLGRGWFHACKLESPTDQKPGLEGSPGPLQRGPECRSTGALCR